MTQKIFLPLTLAFFLAFATSITYAQEPNVTFPIVELGGCTSKAECKTYCDNPANSLSCISFAESHGLMSAQEVAQARKFSEQTGPGGCRGSECRSYCSDPANREGCTAFAKEHGLTPPPLRAEIEKKIRERSEFRPNIEEPSIDEDRAMRVVEESGGPGGCRTKDACRAFCDTEGNRETCFAFAAEHSLMSSGDLERARAMMSKTGPGGCKGVECRTYCENPDHSEECLAFAEQEGFIKPEEAKRARKLLNTTGPGGCRGRECQQYCEDPTRQKECFEFAVQNDLILEGEVERIREFMEKGGPGGCHSPEECERLCLERPEQCGALFPGGNPEESRGGQTNFSGPGGCNGPEECARYCSEHPSECQGFAPPQGEGRDFGQEGPERRGFNIPSGQMPCKTPEECRALYQKRSSEFQPMMDGRGEERSDRMQIPTPRPLEGASGAPTQFEKYPNLQYQQEYQNQYQEQYQQQHQEQYRQYEGTGVIPPPSQPPSLPPPSMESAPQSSINPASLVASIGAILRLLLGF